jgi:lysophospholipase L1-like esterase
MQRVAFNFKPLLKNLAASLVGLVLAVVLLEAVLALFLPAPLIYRYPQPLYDLDEQLGWVMRPHQHSFTIDKPVATNSFGFRSPEIVPAKPPGLLRILCLGDSQTFGNGVDQDLTYPALLQARIGSRAGTSHVQVVNTGVQGYDPVQEVDLLQRLAPRLRPDVVTVGIYLNDMGDAVRTDKKELIDPRTGEFARRGARSWTPYPLIYLLKRSRLVTFIYWRVVLLQSGGAANPMTDVLEGHTPARYEEGWRLIENALVRARDLGTAQGFRVIVFPVPAAQDFRKDYPREQYRSRVLKMAERLGLDRFDPTPVLKSRGGGFERYFIMWDGHISVATHQAIAAMLDERISFPATSASPP